MISAISQQKPLCCYLILITWVIIIILYYKYFEFGTEGDDVRYEIPVSFEPKYIHKAFNNYNAEKPYSKYGKLYKSCNILPAISLGSEGKVNGSYTLENVLIMLRHGDRGTLHHIRDMSRIPCGAIRDSGSVDNIDSNSSRYQLDDDLYKNFTNLLYSYPYSSGQSNFPFAFLNAYFHHSILSTDSDRCEIGQLTLVGIQQLLKLGQLLKSVYYDRIASSGNAVVGPKKTLLSGGGDVVLYSTKYKRTLLSASSFLYSFLSDEHPFSWSATNNKIVFREAYSLMYCFDDCVCPVTDALHRAFLDENSRRMKSHPAISKLIGRVSPIVLASGDSAVSKDLYALKDALLTYVCHDSELPCSSSRCVRYEDVSRLFSYADWDAQQSTKSLKLMKFCLLKAYGLVKNIVSHILKMVSEKKPKMVVYSAHDKTIHILLTAFGILKEDAVFPKYASRVIVEVYSNSTSVKNMDISTVKQYYFRLVYNGKDITKDIRFCQDKYQEITHFNKRTNRTSKTYICSIENIVRFLHDDYFSVFNSTNYKDACEYKFFKT